VKWNQQEWRLIMNMHERIEIRALSASELDEASGGLGPVAIAIAGYLIGKGIDGVVQDSGVIDPVPFDIKHGGFHAPT
jgi:hypothetical protein